MCFQGNSCPSQCSSANPGENSSVKNRKHLNTFLKINTLNVFSFETPILKQQNTGTQNATNDFTHLLYLKDMMTSSNGTGWMNNRDAGDLRRHRAHYDVTVMSLCETTGWVVIYQSHENALGGDCVAICAASILLTLMGLIKRAHLRIQILNHMWDRRIML